MPDRPATPRTRRTVVPLVLALCGGIALAGPAALLAVPAAVLMAVPAAARATATTTATPASPAAGSAAVARGKRDPDTANRSPGNAPQVTAPNSRDSPALAGTPEENITVSANKRRQRTRDVAGSVTVLTGSQLQGLGAQNYADYLKQVPGAVFSEGIPGLSTVSFRGITDTNLLDQGQGTTGYFLNDVPLAEPGFAVAIPDIDTFDVSRVEVLRGPQSTLFGSATLGGAVNYIANTADAHRVDAAIETTIDGTEGARDGEVGYAEKAMVNIPLIRDRLAVRAVLDYRQDPGYVDNVTTGEKDANQDLLRDARVSVVWTPIDDTKLTYLYLTQNNKISDQGYTQPAFGEYNKSTLFAEPYYTATQLHSLRLDHELGFGTLTAQAAYIRKNEYLGADGRPFYAGTLGSLSPYADPQTGDSKAMYYEVRVASHDDRHLTWIAGAAYYRAWKRIGEQYGLYTPLNAQGLPFSASSGYTSSVSLTGPATSMPTTAAAPSCARTIAAPVTTQILFPSRPAVRPDVITNAPVSRDREIRNGALVAGPDPLGRPSGRSRAGRR